MLGAVVCAVSNIINVYVVRGTRYPAVHRTRRDIQRNSNMHAHLCENARKLRRVCIITVQVSRRWAAVHLRG